MRSIILVFLISFSLNFSFAKSTQEINPPVKQSIFDLVNYQDVLEVNIEFDVNKLLSNRRSGDAFKGTFSFTDNHGKEQSWKTKIKIRGKFRRSKCSEMPPLKLNFKKGELDAAGLALFDDFKLVTECVEEPAKAKELLLKEFLAYKMYNELTEYSFRVQFLKINYKDLVTGEIDQQWGFIIEDTAQLRARLGAEKCDQKFGIDKAKVNADLSKTMALFQYMIGNLDYDLYERSHNVKLVEKDGKLIPIPYDFDFSGLVSAPYARLNVDLKAKSIKDRMYLGDVSDLENIERTKELFKSKKTILIDLVKGFKHLNRDSRQEITSYIRSFYKTMDEIVTPEIFAAAIAE